jgi:hypothetical protein
LNVQYGDSTISHKAEVLPEAEGEGPQRIIRGRRRRRRSRRMLEHEADQVLVASA